MVGKNVLVSVYPIILLGVRIGSNVIVGAAAVVTKVFLDNSVVADVPERIISSIEKYRTNIESWVE